MNSALSLAQQEAIIKSILDGDANRLEEFLIAFKDDAFIRQWGDALKAHSKESADAYEQACAIIAYKHYFNNWSDYEKFKEE